MGMDIGLALQLDLRDPRARDEPDGAGGCRTVGVPYPLSSCPTTADDGGRRRLSLFCMEENLSSRGVHPPLRNGQADLPDLPRCFVLVTDLHSHVTELTDMTKGAESSGCTERAMNS